MCKKFIDMENYFSIVLAILHDIFPAQLQMNDTGWLLYYKDNTKHHDESTKSQKLHQRNFLSLGLSTLNVSLGLSKTSM